MKGETGNSLSFFLDFRFYLLPDPLMDGINLQLVFACADPGAANTAAQIDLRQIGHPGSIHHQVNVGVGEVTSLHHLLAKLPLCRCGLTDLVISAEMQIISEIIRIVPPVRLHIIIKDHHSNIPAVRFKGLYHKGIWQGAQ